MLIPVLNPETDDLEKSYLSNSYAAGVTSLEIKNNDRFAANDRIMIGEMGQEKTEVVTVSGTSGGTTLTVGTTVFEHSADDPVYILRFDQVKFYKSTDGTSYSVLSTQNLDVDNADLATKYDDTTGTSSDYYKFTFYHSISGVESAYSDVIGGAGWRRQQIGNIIDEILREVSDLQETFISRAEILGYFNDVNDELLTEVARPYSFLHTRTTFTRTSGRNYIDFPTDSNSKQTMWGFDRMDYNFTDNTTSPVTDVTSTIPVISMEELRNRYTDNTIDTTTESDEKPAFMALDDAVNRFRFSHPALTTTPNVFYLYYWKYFTDIDSEGDVIETPTPKIYKLYIKGMYYRKRAVTEKSYLQLSDRYFADYQVEKAKLKGVDRRDRGTPRRFRPRSTNFSTYRR